MKTEASCDLCAYYEYDEETEAYVCNVNMDEDDMVNFVTGASKSCPYFLFYDEYKMVKRQN